MGKVTDPALLAQLEGGPKPVSDPALLEQLNADTGPTKLESLGRGAAQGATLGSGDEVQGLVQAAGMKYLPAAIGGGTSQPVPWQKEFWDKKTPGGFFSTEASAGGDPRGLIDIYREQRDVARRDDDAARVANPKTFLAGEVAGGALPALATSGGAGAATKAPGLLRALGRTAASGAKWGAVTGLGDSRADLTHGDVEGAAADTAKGAAAGAAINTGLTGAGKLLKGAINGVVKLDPANQLLRAMGVRNLTLGQAAPKSWYNSVEQSAESLPIIGDVIKGQRQAGRASWQNAVLNEARAPGAAVVDGTHPADVLSKVADTFDAAYKPIADLPAQAAVSAPGRFAAPGARLPLSAAFQEAAADPSVRATDEVRRSVASFLDNAHSELTTTATSRPLTAGDLISVRSQIRSEIRNELSGGAPDYAAARLLKNAEDAISTSLTEQLPKDAAAALHATDAQYGKLMRVTDAVRRAGDQPGGFTPAQLSAAVKSGAEKSSYARGGGGTLRELAAAGRATLDQTSPPTGARLLTLGLGTAALPATAALAAAAATDIGKKLLVGGTSGQLVGQRLLKAIVQQKLAVEAARRAALVGTTEAVNQ